ncbi:type II pantothenate kinase [Angomonas deanei]|uniref:AMP-binding enzyme/Fumble, putative n=1 Tax=Angomonas deanei TaxID=59799 RepID=A0A7G2CJ27_9TRYP|nr:type II pantothenate kinase [Angomonas deanei]CAD2219057.1 AMP-binding enzyme/Fumble, putative [Angomonas deanei]|eukprot:EPY33922.1 type II pantothenate kinase [Angomonas deanei]
MWERCVSRFRTLKCLGYINDKSEVSWLTFGAVDTRVRIIALGLHKLGLQRGDIVGVQCEACVNGVLLELACAHLGVATFSLVGKGSVVRSLIDEYKMKIVFSGSGSVNMLLSCRSTVLETVVLMDNATSEENVVLGKDLNIELIPFIRLEHDGGAVLTGGVPKSQCDASSVFTYNLDNSSMDEVLTAVPMTHDDVLREIRILFASRVIPNGYKGDTIIWYSPFSGMFSRLAVIAILSQGNAVGCSSSNHLQEVFQKFKPTILVASPSLFKMSEIQLQRAMQRYSWLYNWMFRVSYNLRSRLIHVNRKDSSLLRFLFFRSSAAQLGGYIRKIVLCSSQETSLFDLIEHISVCYAPVVQEVTYQNRIGVCTVDSVPSPNLTVELDPIDPFCSKAGIGRLSVQKLESKEKYSLDIAAVWESTQSLVLLGPSQGILWPDNYQYAIAIQLERIFINSRFITNVFLYCEPCKPIVAVVHPNRDTLEFEWQQEGTEKGKHFAWRDLVDFAPSIIMKDFHKLAVDYKVNPSHVPEKVHLHPHSFRNHSTFFTPFGKLRRRNVKSYFNAVIDKMYGKSYDDLAELNMDHVSDSDCSLRTPLTGERAVLRVPFAIDIGGTFAKIVYISPPDRRLKPPPHFTHENSSLSETLNIRTSKFFSTDGGKSEVAAAGQLKFGKIPSSEIPNFVEFIKRSGVTQYYRREFIDHIRATGGGAFKYASLVKNSLNITLDIVKEMEAVVLGLNLIIKLAPSSIFMVEPATGRQLPHQLSVGASGELSPFPYLLINIGSGISFIKCTNESGAHVRVGGSPIGGATFWGLTKSLTNLTSWEEVLEIMRLDGPGDNKNVDLLVGDIYGFNAKDLPAMLSSETVASSFGKYGTDRFVDNTTAQDYNERGAQYLSPLSATGGDFSIHTKTSERSVGREEASSMDVVRSLLNMIAGNVTQLAYLHSKMHGVKNIFFAGGFVRDNPLVWNFISSTLLYWSSGECKAHFLQHDGYLGSLGCAVLGSTEADD